MSRQAMLLAIIGSLILYIILGAANLWMGELNQDEGWYLYAAHQVTEGRLPYRDYAYTQAPVMPFVYSLADPLVATYGVAGGRAFTWALGLIGLGLAGALAARLAPQGHAWTALALGITLAAVNVYQSYFTTVVKTYALSSLFVTGGLLALTFWRGRAGGWTCAAAGLLLALAAGTRISSGIALPVVGLFLLFHRATLGNRCWIVFGIGGAVGLAGVLAPWLWIARDGFLFGVFDYHSARSVGSGMSLLVYKLGFISRLAQAYFVALSLGVVLLALRWLAPAPKSNETDGPHMARVAWLVLLAISLVHFMAPFPYDDYQVMLYPLFAAALAAAWTRYAVAGGNHQLVLRVVLLAAFVLSLVSAGSSPINQSWLIAGRDRIWWRLKDKTAVSELREAAQWIRDHSNPDDELLTQDIYLAVEAGRRVPPGMEMGPFSYFAELPTARAQKLRVLNREMLSELLRKSAAPVAAVSEYGFAIRSPEIIELDMDEQTYLWELLHNRYEVARIMTQFGQGATTLKLMVLRHKAADASP